jgi:ADP-ribose pyrophosphatase YjhB (NUDIX family)
MKQVPHSSTMATSTAWDPITSHPFNDETRERVGAIVYDVLGKLLIVEGAGGKMSLPKGCRFFGETVWDGGVRELYEETGLDIEALLADKSAKSLGTKQLRWGTYNVFQLKMRGTDLALRPQAGETCKVLWRDPKSQWMQRKADLNADLRHLVKG